ncbi:hypothetical protein NDU88_005121 [Pleurodeles waltl]|uniref:Uncharacterized protein n=1 Tax=Pleurodeles waltl TaxID=8319 RepID=A0AAV7L267_PLEWA|nr:hypothetical protein NDU88_005121 [Pleurodeles waltl]
MAQEPERTSGPPSEPAKSPKKEEAEKKLVVATDCRKGAPLRSFFFRVVTFGPLKYVFKVLQKMMALVGFPVAVEDVGSADLQTSSPTSRRVIAGKKRLGRLARFLLSVAPQRLQTALGYPVSKGLGDGDVPDEVRQSPTKPCGKGSKRKVEDVALEEQQSWIEALAEDLPDENDEGDVTYQLSKSETDSEEYQSKNDTESDLEFEEKDGITMLKECVPEGSPEGKAMVNGEMPADCDAVNGDLTNGAPEKMTNGDREQSPSSTE